VVLLVARAVVAVVAASAAAQIGAVADRAVSASDGQIVAGIGQPSRDCRRRCQVCLARAHSSVVLAARVRRLAIGRAALVARALRSGIGRGVRARSSVVLAVLVAHVRHLATVDRVRVVLGVLAARRR
jgi:hypothetical protein